MTIRKYLNARWLALLGVLCAASAVAQTISITEDFNSTSTVNNWYYFNGACLTASSSAGSGSPGTPPGCTAIKSSYYGENLVGGIAGAAGSAQTLPDTNYNGALRFTNGCVSGSTCGTGGHSQNGAIISMTDKNGNPYSSTAGIQITFKTVTYRGDSGGTGKDGADGMSFFLINGSATPNIGSWGGSLGYTCSNSNADYHGMVGAYIGLGIDEYGNFLNAGDNTASGFGYVPNRIGMRGQGSIAWSYLNTLNSTYYPSTLTSAQQQAAVLNTCKTGYLWNYSNASNPTQTSTSVYDYPALPSAYKVLTGVSIANEYSNGGYARPNGLTGTGSVPGSVLTYKLKITPDAHLSLSYSVNGGSWLGVLSNQSITASNGTLPTTIGFGFAGSTGGSSNIHELMCFKAASLDASSSSAAANLKQSAKVTSSSQAYFAYYDPTDWTGRLTANALNVDSSGNLSIASTAKWDASCVLTGVANLTPATLNSSSVAICPATGLTTATSVNTTAAQPWATGAGTTTTPAGRIILSWNGSTGVPFEWPATTGSGTLTAAQQSALDAGDSTQTATRLNFLRGDRSNEMVAGVGLYRDRDSILGDIVDSSPTPIGQPVASYPNVWQDKLNSSATIPENSGTHTYTAFQTAEASRLNVVYAGANDGMLHGFESGFYSGATLDTGTNDGLEVLAYMPAAVVNTIHNSSTVELDYANAQYGHNFYVDAPPGSGDLFYSGAWHTWLVGGLGPGGAAIYALDVTDPTGSVTGTTAFSEANASSLVMGEWSAANIVCANASSCATSLGNTYGTPVIRRLHDGKWAVIFGNGFGSSTGDAGIFIALINTPPALPTFYYLSTGETGANDGIAYVTARDLDGDNITDYVYAGDLLGNVWRFDLTSATESNWAASSAPLFSAGSSQPITSAVLVNVVQRSPGFQVMVSFGTGQQIPVTNSSATSYASGTQSLYAFWDWNFALWNQGSSVPYLNLAVLNTAGTAIDTTASETAAGLTSMTLAPTNLTAQTLTDVSTTNTVDITSSTICWSGTTTCSGNNKSFGWRASLPGSSEQIIYNPQLIGTAFNVNSVIPANTSPLSCSSGLNTGYSYAITLVSGAAQSDFFASSTDTTAVGLLTNATGTSTVVTTSTNSNSTTTSTTTVNTGISTNVSSSSSSSSGTTSSSSSSSSGTSSSSSGSSGTTSSSGTTTTGTPANTTTNPTTSIFSPTALAGCQPQTKTWLVSQTSSGTPLSTQTNPTCALSGSRATWTHLR